MLKAAKSAAKQAYSTGLDLWRRNSSAGRRFEKTRKETDQFLNAFARSTSQRFAGRVIVDATFDNPNYWFRYSLLRHALGLAHADEIGAIGPYRRTQVRSTLDRYGVQSTVDLAAAPDACNLAVAQARALLARTVKAEDVLHWKLPGGVHPSIVYDGILKRQRLAALNVHHPEMEKLTIEALTAIERTREILDATNPALVVVSHPFNFICGSLAWQALARGIPVILPFGLFGVLRFTRFREPNDLFAFYDRPTRAEMDELPTSRADAMADIGRTYLASRFAGKADDLASVFAFQRNQGSVDRDRLCLKHGWNPAKPIVAFYASNWFDWPHQLGMTNFRDFLDWTEATFDAAKNNGSVNWLFKPHPAEDWFGGIALTDIMARIGQAPNVAIADKDWNNGQVMSAVDALITYHGTAGVEFAALGKPALVPDRGKYEDCGFVRVAASREEYLDLLATDWWSAVDRQDIKRRAEIFAGWWFCAPEWQGQFILGDDGRQESLYDKIIPLVRNNPDAVARELGELQRWWASGHSYYHTTKMMSADSFQLSNV